MTGTDVTTIPRLRRVFYDTYANFPTDAAPEDLAYATDTLRLYRWNGAAWQPITNAGALITNGTYTGNDAVNRAIPHGLGVIPKLVVIYGENVAVRHGILNSIVAKSYAGDNTADSVQAQTAMTSTNFYVGAANLNTGTVVYDWAAIG